MINVLERICKAQKGTFFYLGKDMQNTYLVFGDLLVDSIGEGVVKQSARTFVENGKAYVLSGHDVAKADFKRVCKIHSGFGVSFSFNGVDHFINERESLLSIGDKSPYVRLETLFSHYYPMVVDRRAPDN